MSLGIVARTLLAVDMMQSWSQLMSCCEWVDQALLLLQAI